MSNQKEFELKVRSILIEGERFNSLILAPKLGLSGPRDFAHGNTTLSTALHSMKENGYLNNLGRLNFNGKSVVEYTVTTKFLKAYPLAKNKKKANKPVVKEVVEVQTSLQKVKQFVLNIFNRNKQHASK